MNTNTMELNLDEMEMVNGGWNWKESIFWGVVCGTGGAFVGGHVAGVPGAIVGGAIGTGIGIMAGHE